MYNMSHTKNVSPAEIPPIQHETESIRTDIQSYAKRLQEARDQGKYWKQEEDIARKRLIALMGPDSIEEFPDIVVTSFVHEQRRLIPDRVRDEYPDVAEICTEVTSHTRIEIHRRGEQRKPGSISSRPPSVPPRKKLDSDENIDGLLAQFKPNLPPTEELIGEED